MRHRALGFLALPTVLLLACDGAPDVTTPVMEPQVAMAPVASGQPPAALPFHGFWEADGPAPPPVPPAGYCREGALGAVLHTYTGRATHFGRFEMFAVLCQFPDGSYEGEATITTANGDEVYADFFNGRVVRIDPPFLYLQDEVVWTGGTGRFANVSGGGTEFITFDLTKGFGRAEMEATISYDASDRSRRRRHTHQ